MSYTITRAETRLARMVTWLAGVTNKITDWVPGGKTRTKLETVAVEMESQDVKVYQAIKKAIPVAVYRAFDFSLLPAVATSGEVTFSASVAPASPVVIPAGTQVATVETATESEVVYETQSETTLPAGNTDVNARVVCTTSGPGGNTGANTITVLKTSIPGIDSVANAAPLTNGAEQETEDARRLRFLEYVAALSRATEGAIVYGAKTAQLTDANGVVTERVTQAKEVDPTAAPWGAVACFVYNGTGATSSQLVARAQEIIDGYEASDGTLVDGYKAAGVVCTVVAVTEVSVNVTVALTLFPGYDATTVQGHVEGVIGAYLGSLGIGETFVFHELVERVMGVAGVRNVAFTTPTGDIEAQYVPAATFNGAGLDDATSGGSYTGEGTTAFLVEIDGTGSPDTFRWSTDGGSTWEASTVAITGAAQTLDRGVTVTFAATTGHTSGDQWTFSATGGVVLTEGTVTVT